MGTQVKVYLEKSLEGDRLYGLLDRLNEYAAPPAADEAKFYRLSPPELAPDVDLWRVSELADFESIGDWAESRDCFPLLLDGPFHVSLSIGARLFSLWHPFRWRIFQEHAAIQKAIRDFAARLATAVECHGLIYAPDCYPNFALDGYTFGSTLDWLGEHVGPPPPTVPAYSFDYQGYYVEWLPSTGPN